MSIRVQCDQCGSVMNIREDYIGTERHCPKCQTTFIVPAASASEKASVPPAAKKAKTPSSPSFDTIAFLAGDEASGGKKTSTAGKGATKPKTHAPPQRAASAEVGEFDPLDVLDEGKSRSGAKPSGAKPPATKPSPAQPSPAKSPPPPDKPSGAEADFDPLDVLGVGPKSTERKTPRPQAPKASSAANPAGARNANPEAVDVNQVDVTEQGKKAPQDTADGEGFDPLDVLGSPAARGGAGQAGAAGSPSSKPQDRPTPRRPAWAKPPPEPESDDDWKDEPSAPEPPKPKRPSWAKPLPGEEVQPAEAGSAPGEAQGPDLSPAAKAAASAVSTTAAVSKSNPALQEVEKRPLIDRAALVAGLRRRLGLMVTTLIVSAIAFGASWLIFRPDLDMPPLAPVDGRVTVDGKPLEGARVIFTPRNLAHRSAEAVTDSDGSYRLEFTDGWFGAPAGRYRVRLELIAETGRDMIPVQFGTQTRQTAVVQEGGSTIDITIGGTHPAK